MAYSRLPWQKYGGLYRPVDTAVQWQASPESSPILAPASLSVVSPPRSEVTNRPEGSTRSIGGHRRRRTWLVRVLRLFSSQSSEPSDPPQAFLVPHSEWKAWGYYACPTINGVTVNNWSPAHQIRRTYHFRELVRSLRDRDGSKHPERWLPGVWHPSLPPRPNRWIEPNLRDPLPPPSQCQLNPFLQHIQYGPAPLCWDIGQPPTGVLYGQTTAAIPLSPADKAQPATFPFLPEMHICAVAEDSLSKFQWPVTIRSSVGITCEDIFAVVYENFRRHVSEAEVAMWSSLRRKQASVAFHARFGHRIQDEMRRIDYFGQCIMFRGLEPHPSGRGWVLFLGLA